MNYNMTRNIAVCGLAMALSVSAHAAPSQDAAYTKTGNFIADSYGKCVRTKWLIEGDVCAPKQKEQKASVVPQREWAKEDRTVYFDFNRATLSSEAKGKIETLTRVLKTDADVQKARIVGYADRMGHPSYNEQLSRRRAEAVRQYMVSRGFMKAEVAQTQWLGETAPLSVCADSLPREQLIACMQKDRRVEVEIDYLTPANATE